MEFREPKMLRLIKKCKDKRKRWAQDFYCPMHLAENCIKILKILTYFFLSLKWIIKKKIQKKNMQLDRRETYVLFINIHRHLFPAHLKLHWSFFHSYVFLFFYQISMQHLLLQVLALKISGNLYQLI